jgi:hypothetical protein
MNLQERRCRDGVGWQQRWWFAAVPLATKAWFSVLYKSSAEDKREGRKVVQRP